MMTDPTAARAARLAEVVAYALQRHPDGLNVRDLALMLGESREALSEALSGLRVAGLAETAGPSCRPDEWHASTPVLRGRVRGPVGKIVNRSVRGLRSAN